MGYWGRSSSLIRAFPAAPLGQTAPFMAGIWGLPLINFTRPFSTATWMGHRTVHIPHTLNTEPAVMIFLSAAQDAAPDKSRTGDCLPFHYRRRQKCSQIEC